MIFPMEKIYKDYYQMSDSEIEEAKKGLEQDQKDPVFGAQMGGLPPPGGAPMGAPPGAPMESAENAPPTEQPPPPAPESLDYDAMKSLAIESGCDDELIKLLEDMSRK